MKYLSGSVKNDERTQSRKQYQTPAIIYKGKISTRAGTIIVPPNPINGSTVADPADLFGDND